MGDKNLLVETTVVSLGFLSESAVNYLIREEGNKFMEGIKQTMNLDAKVTITIAPSKHNKAVLRDDVYSKWFGEESLKESE